MPDLLTREQFMDLAQDGEYEDLWLAYERKIMAEPKTEIDRRLDRHEAAIRKLAEWLEDEDRKKIEDILDGTKTAPEDSAGTAD